MPAPLVYGLALMVYRYLMPNVVTLVLIGLVLVAIPYFFRIYNGGYKFMGFLYCRNEGLLERRGCHLIAVRFPVY